MYRLNDLRHCIETESDGARERQSIFANIINNSLNAFRRAGSASREIAISTDLEGDNFEARIADSGPGLVGVLEKDIWLPGVTTETDGTGLGLTIVRDTVTDLGGTVDVIPNGRLGGAEFIVRLPVIGS